MPFQIVRNDITRVKADAIVNTANPCPIVGSGTDSAIYRAAGHEKLLEARRKIGELAPGEVAATSAFALDARYIIHASGPMWVDGTHSEKTLLSRCYSNALMLSAELGCESIAFSLMGSGTYGFPKSEALDVALAEIGRFLLTHELTVILVVFDRESVALSKELVGEIDTFIDEHTVGQLHAWEYDNEVLERMERDYRGLKAQEGAKNTSLDKMLAQQELGFRERLFRLIDARDIDDVTVYKRANLDRKVFSRIRCKADYKPSKKTALALAIALELDLATTRDLLARAGYALSPSSRFDLIVSYFIERGSYDMLTINTALFSYGEETLT